MRLRIVALLFLVFPLTLNAQYSSLLNPSVTDLTSYLPTTNAWKALPQGGICLPNTLFIDSDGTAYCRGTDYFPYTTTAQQATWVKVPAMGTQMYRIMQSAGVVYALGPGGYDWATCQTQGPNSYSILAWTGSAWAPRHGCLSEMYPADGVLVGVNVSQDSWKSTDGGNSWAQISGHSIGPNFTYIAAAADSMMCGTNGIQVFVLSSAGFTILPHQPNNADIGVSGCVYESNSAGSTDSIYAWGPMNCLHNVCTGVGVQRYDINSDTWSNVAGMNTTEGLTTIGKGMLLGLDSSGHPYHLNVYGAYLSIAVTGSDTSGCGNTPCPGSANHRVTTQVAFPHGLSGTGENVQGYSPSTNVNQSSFDFTVSCDPLFGDPNDPECIATTIGQVYCSVLQAVIFLTQEHFPVPIAWGFKEVTHKRLPGAPTNCSTHFGDLWCWYPVQASYPASCPNPGPYIFTESFIRARVDVVNSPPPGGPINYWRAIAECVKFQDTGWTCIPELNLGRPIKPSVPCDTLNE